MGSYSIKNTPFHCKIHLGVHCTFCNLLFNEEHFMKNNALLTI